MIRRLTVLLLLCLLMFTLIPVSVLADAAEKTESRIVRVGWYEAPFNRKDSFGRRTGYAYDYQRKIAAYTGWKYQYVEGTWTELLELLKDGRIDLMSDVSFTEERTEYMLYSHIPMGTEVYYLFVSPDNQEIRMDDYSSLNGKRVGVTGTSVQKTFFLQWQEKHGVQADVVSLDCSEEDSLRMMKTGAIDAFVTPDTYGDPELALPVWKIDSSDFYFVVAKDRPDLLAELDTALSRIQDENKLYRAELSAKYLQESGSNRYLTPDEIRWLDSHGPIRVGYQDHYLAFCATDPRTGELTGALKDYLHFASGVLNNAQPEFVAIGYATASEAMEALARGEVDCMFPANLTDYDAEIGELVMSPPLMRTEMDAVVRQEDKQDFLRHSQVRVGVNRGNPNYELFLTEHYPTWTPVLYNDTPACLDAVASKNADCILISNYRYHDIAHQCERLNLTTVYTGVDMDYSFALKEGDSTLYSILAKVISQVPKSTVNAALTYYSSEGSSRGLFAYLQDHPPVVILIAINAVLLVIILLLAIRLRAEKKSGRTALRTQNPPQGS